MSMGSVRVYKSFGKDARLSTTRRFNPINRI